MDYTQKYILLFECADDCKTVLDVEHLKEIRRFMKIAMADPLWGKICYKAPGALAVDGVGCTNEAYQNLTRYVDPMLDSATDEEI